MEVSSIQTICLIIGLILGIFGPVLAQFFVYRLLTGTMLCVLLPYLASKIY